MVKSMTGFGRAEGSIGDKVFIVELKALNGKQFDLQLKIPSLLKTGEFDIRNQIQENLLRGTVDCYITLKQNGVVRPSVLNSDLLLSYLNQVKEVAGKNLDSYDAVLGNLLRLPEIFSPSTEIINEDEFNSFSKILQQAIDALIKHRQQEGETLHADLNERMENIQKLSKQIEPLGGARMERIKSEIRSLLNEHVGKESIDENRMEQELIYYMEKIDIHEEQIRLNQHCDYYYEVLNSKEQAVGKKLSFILQEIGREINTTGSKAYDAEIQKLVVQMKDELEKAKEQVLNVL